MSPQAVCGAFLRFFIFGVSHGYDGIIKARYGRHLARGYPRLTAGRKVANSVASLAVPQAEEGHGRQRRIDEEGYFQKEAIVGG